MPQAGLRWLLAEPRNLDEVQQALTRIVRDGLHAGEVISRIRALTCLSKNTSASF